ncbi:MAG: serine/threonine protein kinase, partial [Candidatus Dormibacteraeota bacterium]|nr:serine/threonine protein kinase [Candidatus Dormibacteraeota bacterium]
TVARTLAVLCFDFRGYQSTYRFTLPDQESVPVLEHYDSLYRFLLAGTAPDPADRFQSAEEMADQLYGVLREVVADQDGHPVPGPSTHFSGPIPTGNGHPDWRALPRPQADSDDPAAGFLATITAADPQQLIEQLAGAPERTLEVELRRASGLIALGDWSAVEETLVGLEDGDQLDWRGTWYRGVADLARGRPGEANAGFTAAYHSLPGELAPKLGLAFAYELSGEPTRAAAWYDVVSRTDPAFTAATFGLARCRLQAGDRPGALAAYDRVPESSSAYLEAQTARIRCLAGTGDGATGSVDELLTAGSMLETLPLTGPERARLQAEVLESALALVQRGEVLDDGRASLLGHRFQERDLRFGLERSYRELARWAPTTPDRIRLVDRANQVRPRTWT